MFIMKIKKWLLCGMLFFITFGIGNLASASFQSDVVTARTQSAVSSKIETMINPKYSAIYFDEWHLDKLTSGVRYTMKKNVVANNTAYKYFFYVYDTNGVRHLEVTKFKVAESSNSSFRPNSQLYIFADYNVDGEIDIADTRMCVEVSNRMNCDQFPGFTEEQLQNEYNRILKELLP